MAKSKTKVLPNQDILVSVPELGEIVGLDLETINNWINRKIINRAELGGRQMRNRLFSIKEIYQASFTNELVKLGIGPKSASEAVIELYKHWDLNEPFDDSRMFAMFSMKGSKWSVLICTQLPAGGSLSKADKAAKEFSLPDQAAFLMINLSECVSRIQARLKTVVR